MYNMLFIYFELVSLITIACRLIQNPEPTDSVQTLSSFLITRLLEFFSSHLPVCTLALPLTTSARHPKAACPSFGGDPAVDDATAPLRVESILIVLMID